MQWIIFHKRTCCAWIDTKDLFSSNFLDMFEISYEYSVAPVVKWTACLPRKQVACVQFLFVNTTLALKASDTGPGSIPVSCNDFFWYSWLHSLTSS